MKIEYLRIKNFKALKDVEIRNIPNFCVIVGANGSGKSTLFSVFGFLKDALSTNVHDALALNKMGGPKGFDEVRSRGSNGNIEIELKFRRKQDTGNKNNPLITYFVSIGKDERGRGIVEREILKYRRGQTGQPWEFLNFSKGEGKAVINESLDTTKEADMKREDQKLKSPDILAIKGLAQFEKFPAAVDLGELIDSWHLSDIHISEARRDQEAGIAEHLSPHGDNLYRVIDYFYQNYPEKMEKIIESLKNRVPGIVSAEAKLIETGEMLLKLKDKSFDEPFLVRFVSDGTVKMLAYLVLLYDPKPHALLCVEEPENQLYPTLLEELAEEFRAYTNGGEQVFVSTHSPDFLNAVKMEEVFFLVKQDGYTTIKPASDFKYVPTFMKNGDKMGRLWKQGFFRGVGPKR